MNRLWITVAFTLLLVVSAGRTSSIVGVGGSPAPPRVRLELSPGYIAISPVSRLLDAVTLFSAPQTFGFFGVICACALAAGVAKAARNDDAGKTRRVLRQLAIAFVLSIVAEALAIVLPRPMARLAVDDPEIVSIDFHSHTRASHDANKQFTAERNREWHSSAGFDIAYVTDHVKWEGAIAGRAQNPVLAGTGTSLLTGVEGHYHKVSTIMLGMTQADTARLTHWGELKRGVSVSQVQPVTIAALPANLDSVGAAVADTLPRFEGLELVDAAPRGLGQLDREGARIHRLAMTAGLILVASSNNHGWGRTAAAWNLMMVPGWRRLSPDSVGALIEKQFMSRNRNAVRIIERNRPAVHGAAVVLVLPITAWEVFGSLTMSERGVWLVWIWGAWLIGRVVRRSSAGDLPVETDEWVGADNHAPTS